MKRITINISDSDFLQLHQLTAKLAAQRKAHGRVLANDTGINGTAEYALHVGILYLDADLTPEPDEPKEEPDPCEDIKLENLGKVDARDLVTALIGTEGFDESRDALRKVLGSTRDDTGDGPER
jgi:hypothetical protein